MSSAGPRHRRIRFIQTGIIPVLCVALFLVLSSIQVPAEEREGQTALECTVTMKRPNYLVKVYLFSVRNAAKTALPAGTKFSWLTKGTKVIDQEAGEKSTARKTAFTEGGEYSLEDDLAPGREVVFKTVKIPSNQRVTYSTCVATPR